MDFKIWLFILPVWLDVWVESFLFGWMDLRFERDELFFCLVGWVRMAGLLWHVGSTFHWFSFDQNERFKWDESFFYLVG
jgi:hypothetical protein